MQIKYVPHEGVILVFLAHEIAYAVAGLKAIHKNQPQDFLAQAINDIEADRVQPPNHFHICEHCFTELDDRDPNAFHMTTRSLDGKEVSKWVHYQCPELKLNRPV